MGDKKLEGTIKDLFEGLETLVDSKTVMGEPKTCGDTTIIPLMEVSFGMAAGGYDSSVRKNNNQKGGVGAKIKPRAVLVIKDNSTRILNVGAQSVAEKLIDLAPDIMDRFKKGEKATKEEKEEIIKEAFDSE